MPVPKRLSDRIGRRLSLVGVLLLCVSMAPVDAFGAGLSMARYGGIFGHPNSDGGLSLYWCPARLSAESGGFFTADGTLIYRIASYDRVIEDDASEIEQQVNAGEATSSTAGVMPYLATGYSIPFESVNLAFAAGGFLAHGGSGQWDRHLGTPSEYPGAIDGPQRWSSISASVLVIHYTGAIGLTIPEIGLSFGATGALVTGSIDTTRARNLNRTDDLVDQDGYLLEGRVHLDGSDTTYAFSFGASYENGPVRFSATYHTPYTLRLTGPARQVYATAEPTVLTAYVELPLPNIFRAALTISLEHLFMTFVSDFSTWSSMEENDALAEDTRERILLIPRDLNNTFSVRANVGWTFDNGLGLAGSFGVDPSAVPSDTVDAGLVDSLKFQLGLGIRYAWNHLGLLVSYTHDIYMPVEMTNSQHRPTVNGTFHDTRGFFNVSLEARF